MAPTVSLAASPMTVTSGMSSTLTWSSTNASACTASGAWSGQKAATGSESVGPLTTTSTFALSCSGSGGSAQQSVMVTVNGAPPPAPTLSLNANPTAVQPGGTSSLTWSSTDATTCTASGAWSGPKDTSGSEMSGALASTSTFSLTCTGAGGSVQRSVTVTVNSGGPGSLSGSVDSSWVDRDGDNRVYIFAGNVTPDDDDGDAGDPVSTAAVVQDANACTFAYAASGLPAGQYTVAFTADAASDVPNQNNTLAFAGTATVNIGVQAASLDLVRTDALRVGPGRQFQTVRDAIAGATNGSLVEIDAGIYVDDIAVIRDDNVTLRGVSGRAHLRADSIIPYSGGNDQQNGKGIWVTAADNILIENIEFSRARVPDENGAGIRAEGVGLTICNAYFHDNENGILGGAYGKLLIEYSEFADNGIGEFGRTHNLYIDEGAGPFIFQHNYSHHAHIGHLLKTRADVNFILYNRLMDEASGNSSYTIDVPNGGLTYIVGNLLQQGPNTDNSDIVAYGAEGLSNPNSRLYMINNTSVNDLGSGAHVSITGGTLEAVVRNNIFTGGGTAVSGSAQQVSNLVSMAPGLVDVDGFDYRLTATSPARDAGTAPGSANGFNLTPLFEYSHRAGRSVRPSSGTIDIGAYEFVP